MRKSVCASTASCSCCSIPETWLRRWASDHLLKEITIQRQECCRGIGFFDLRRCWGRSWFRGDVPAGGGKRTVSQISRQRCYLAVQFRTGTIRSILTETYHDTYTTSARVNTVICFAYYDAQNVRWSRQSDIDSCRVLVGRLAAW